MSTTMTTLGGLTVRDVGSQVKFHGADADVSGTLNNVHIDTEWIDVTEFGGDPDDPKRIEGNKTVHVVVGGWETSGLPLATPVTVTR